MKSISMSRIWLRMRLAAARLFDDSPRHRGDRICHDRADHAGDVLWHGRVFIRRGGRPQGNAGGENAVRPDVAIAAGDDESSIFDRERYLSAKCLHRQHSDSAALCGNADAGDDYRNLCRLQQDCEGSMEQGATIGSGATQATLTTSAHNAGRCHCVAVDASGPANLSDLQRSELSLHADRRLRDGDGRRDIERCRLYAAASGRLHCL